MQTDFERFAAIHLHDASGYCVPIERLRDVFSCWLDGPARQLWQVREALERAGYLVGFRTRYGKRTEYIANVSFAPANPWAFPFAKVGDDLICVYDIPPDDLPRAQLEPWRRADYDHVFGVSK
jgi:hypothetical protein